MIAVVLSFGVGQPLPWTSVFGPLAFLYLGPETVLPIASVLAGIIGVMLMFWRYIIAKVRNLYKMLIVRQDEPTELYSDPETDKENR